MVAHDEGVDIVTPMQASDQLVAIIHKIKAMHETHSYAETRKYIDAVSPEMDRLTAIIEQYDETNMG